MAERAIDPPFISALAGGDIYEAAAAHINALHQAAQRRLKIAAHSLGRPPVGTVPPAVPTGQHRNTGLPLGVAAPVDRGRRRVRRLSVPGQPRQRGPVPSPAAAGGAPLDRRPRAGTRPAVGGAR